MVFAIVIKDMTIMQLTSAHAERLRDNLRDNPLNEGEIRRVEGAGEQYIARKGDDAVDDTEHTKTITVEIDGVSHQLYTKLPSDDQSVA
tara:strand:+ start:976 stop:1242 length:267 start_codon:yes stop_codon:yes gene_type:complete